MKLKTRIPAGLLLLPALLNFPASLSAQEGTTVFLTDFSTSTVNPVVYADPTFSSADWVVGATKDHGVGVIEAEGLSLDMGSTSAAFVEAAGRFTNWPVVLTEPGDFIEVILTFTADAGILQGATNSQIGLGLFDTGGVNPPEGVSGQIRFDAADYLTGGMQDWSGFPALIQAGDSNRFFARLPQAETSRSSTQELLFTSNTGGFVERIDLSQNGDGVILVDATAYALVYRATLSGTDGLDLEMSLYQGAGEGGTLLTSVTGQASLADPLSATFDGLGMGYIRKGVAGDSSITYTSLEIVTNKPNLPPSIVSGPNNLTVTAGDNGSLSVSVEGSEPLDYTWYKEGLVDPVATGGSILEFSNADSSIEGNYWLEVSNAYGMAVSPTASVTVTDSPVAPTILEQPVGASLPEGESVTLSVLANGTSPLSYDWKKDGASLGAPDQDNLVLESISPADAGSYTVHITNTAGEIESDPAILEVWEAPVIMDSPSSVLADPGQEIVLNVTASGSPAPTFRWFRNGVQIPGETGSSLTLSSASGADAGEYYVWAENDAGFDASNPFFVNVRSAMALDGVLPVSGNTGLPPDMPIELVFSEPVQPGFSGTIALFEAGGTPVATIDMGAASHNKTVGGLAYAYDPILADGSSASIVFETGTLGYGKSYYLTIEAGAILDATGATFTGITDNATVSFSTRAEAPAADAAFIRVAADGSGDFATVQAAIDHVPASNGRRVTVSIADGLYRELLHIPSNRRYITLKGDSMDGTVVSYLNNANRNQSNQRASFYSLASDLSLESMSFVNETPKGGSQAETLNADGSRIVVRNCGFYSLQDTLKLSDGSICFVDCYIEGDVDFLWDDADAFFGRCTIHSVNKGYLVQTRNGESGKGFVFVDCDLTGEEDAAGTYLGRIEPDRFPYSSAAYIDCAMGDHIAPAGWLLNGATTAPTVRFYEYGTTGLDGNPLDLSARADFATILTDEEAAPYRDPDWVTGFATAPRTWMAAASYAMASGWSMDPALGWLWRPHPESGEHGPWAYSQRLAAWIYLVPVSADEAYFHISGGDVAGWYWNTRAAGNWVLEVETSTWKVLANGGLRTE